MRTKLCIQCKYPETGEIGDFLKKEDGGCFSPLFNDLIPLFDWMHLNYPNAKIDGYSWYIL